MSEGTRSRLSSGNGLTIGRLAKAAQVGVGTIRYYQRLKLLPTPAPVHSAFRHYPTLLIDRIRFIKRAQELGFSLADIAALLRLNDGANRRAIRCIANARLEDIRVKIVDMHKIESVLAKLIHECEQNDHAISCPIIAAFSGQADISSKDNT